MRKTKFRALVILGAVLLLSLGVWGSAAAQQSAEAAASERPFLGVSIADADGAVVIREVVAGSPADEAGLQVDDVITAVNGEEISSASDLADAIGALAPGDPVTIEYTRGDEADSVEVTLGSAPEQIEVSPGGGRGNRGEQRGPRGDRGLRGLRGFNLGSFGFSYDANAQTWTIETLSEDSPLYEAGLREGDVITAVNGEQHDPMSLMQLLMSGADDLALTVERDGEEIEIEVSAELIALLGMRGMFNFGEGFEMPFGQGRGMPFGRGMNRGGMPFHMFGGGRLGVTYVNLDEAAAEEHGADVTEGALITAVLADSPAETAGLQVNDVITAVNGEPVDEERTLRDRLFAYESGDTVTLDVLRAGEVQQIAVTLGEPLGFGGMMPYFEFGETPQDAIPPVPDAEVTAEPNV